MYLEEIGMLDMENPVHRVCLYLVYQPRVQQSLERATNAWNNHRIRTAQNKSPIAMYELSKEKAIRLGYWHSDPGDPISEAAEELYGFDPQAGSPSEDHNESPSNTNTESEKDAGLLVNDDEELDLMRELLHDIDLNRDDDNWGIDVFEEAVRTAEYLIELGNNNTE